ncbi:MAG: hypothetical protein R2865_06455 [Deinococcales bacterium]
MKLMVAFSPDVVVKVMIENVFERHVLGADPFKIERLWRIVYSSGYTQHPDLSLMQCVKRFGDAVSVGTSSVVFWISPFMSFWGDRYEKLRSIAISILLRVIRLMFISTQIWRQKGRRNMWLWALRPLNLTL